MAAPQQTATAAQEVARLAGHRAVHKACAWFQAHARELADWQIEVARVAAPPFGEEQRSEWLAKEFGKLGFDSVERDHLGNLFGIRRGRDTGRYVALSAHMDTVFPAGTPLNLRREGTRLLGPGISDNASGLTALTAIASALAEADLRTTHDLVFIANVGEEGEGNLRGMRHIYEQSRWREHMAAHLVLDGAATDTLVAQALGSRRFEIVFRGPGGHSWSDFGTPNPIYPLARFVEQLSRVPLNEEPKSVLHVGVLSGGSSVNTIPESASARVDIRSVSSKELERLESELRAALELVTSELPAALTHELRSIGDRPAGELPKDARIVQVVQAVDAQLQNQARIQRASTDANIPISRGIEAVALGTGGSGGGAHTVHEWYDPTGRELGLKRILLATLALAGVEG
jgi:tripeptide aminopeptidase